MPVEWLIILQQEKIDVVATYNQLKNMSVDEVQDVLEALDMRKMYKIEEIRIQKEQEAKNNRK
jgi:hypothetical protein